LSAMHDRPTAQSRRPEENLKARLSRIIPAAEPAEIARLLDQLWSAGVSQVQCAPRSGLVMHSIQDAFGVDFHLGEVLVTEARVTCSDCAGCGLTLGDEPERALLLAVTEAAAACGRKALLDPLEAFAAGLEARMADQCARLSKVAAATTVSFETMKKESVDFGTLD